jgi:hypothetical protein
MQQNDFPDATYTTTWNNGQGEVRFFTRADGSRLRYYTAGTGPPLVLMHTVRTQLDYFQRVIPLVWDRYTVYALDLPGMGWSDIVFGARYEEPELRAAVVEFVSGLNLQGITLAGESLGAALALSASIRSQRQGEPGRRVQQLRLPQWTGARKLARPIHHHRCTAARGRAGVRQPGAPANHACGVARRLRRQEQVAGRFLERTPEKRAPQGLFDSGPSDLPEPQGIQPRAAPLFGSVSAGHPGLQRP